jgi:hypothetical protein
MEQHGVSNTTKCAGYVQQQKPAWILHGWTWDAAPPSGFASRKYFFASADAAAVIAIHESSNKPTNKPNKQAVNQYIAF